MLTTDVEQRPSQRIGLPKVATDAQVQSYVDNGYLVLPELMTAKELDELKSDIVKLTRGDYPSENLEPLPRDMSDDEVLNTVLCIHQPHNVSPIIERYMKHPKICGSLAQITGAHLPWWDGSRFWNYCGAVTGRRGHARSSPTASNTW